MPEGKVRTVVAEQGYGFIRPERGEDLFFHFSDVRMLRPVTEGQVVSYFVARDDRRRGPRAVRVTEPVVIFDPDELSPEERNSAELLLGMLDEPDIFDDALLEYVRNPTARMQRAVQSTALVEPVVHALHRLSHRAEVAHNAAKAAGDRGAERDAASLQRLLGTERTRLRPLLNLAYAAAADQGIRQHALRILGKMYYQELRRIMHDLTDGRTMDEAKDAAAKRALESGMPVD